MFLLVLFLSLLALGSSSPTLSVQVSGDGVVAINVNNEEWLSSSDFSVYSGGSWYSSSDKSLALVNSTKVSGSDVLGAYSSQVFSWTAKIGSSSYTLQTFVKSYPSFPNAVIFGQLFPQGLPNTAIGSEDTPITSFPSFSVVPKLDMAGSTFSYGIYPAGFQGGYKGGPIALFDSQLNTLVLSSFTNFLSVITNRNSSVNSVLNTGIQGKIPAGYGFEYVVSLNQGVNNAFMRWGDILLARYGKERLPPTISTVVQYLGYSTTGYYFYNPLDGNASYGNYEETMLAFNDYSTKLGVPYKYYLLDSWWYGEQVYDVGVWMWEDNHDLLAQRFPHGLEWLHNKLGMPFVAHMGKWDSSSPYTKNESYGFVTEKQWAVPTAVEFWDYIFQNASGWGLNTIKQDHMDEQVLDMVATLSDVTTTRDWILSEGKGAWHNGINIEYCMDYSSVVLTSLENPTATHSRAGGDYVPKDANWQWRIGVTSMFLWAIGLYPDKDTFYTTTTEIVANNPKAPFYNFTEPYPLTHAIASSMSAGPITPSDGIGGTDKTLVMRMCAADGLLLKPDRPAIYDIDSTWIQRSFGGSIGPKGDVITSYTQIGPFVWHFIFGVQLTATYSFVTSDLLLPYSGKYVAFQFSSSGQFTLVNFNENSPLEIPAGATYGDYSFWIVAPVLDNGFLGETDKFITVSKQRFKSVTTSNNRIQLEIAGEPGEQVTLSFAPPGSTTVQTYQCSISPSGFSLFTLPGATCIMN